MTHKTYLVSIHNGQPVAGQSDNVAEFVAAWMAALGERAAIMREDARLTQCAQAHALYLSQRTGSEIEQSMHIGQGGSHSNARVLDSGYKLPREYKRDANNVESCARNSGGPQAALQGLLASPAHHDHLMGVNGFSDRVVYAVANVGEYWVVLACPPEGI